MKKKTIFISVISLFIIFLAVYSNSATNEFNQQNNKQPSKSSKIQSTKNNNTSKPTIASQVQGISNAGNQKQQNTGKDEHNWYDKFLDVTITDCLLTLFNALLAFFSYRLWKTTRALWKVSQDQYIVMDKQATALEKSVSITEAVASATERSANATLAAARAAKRSAESLPRIERAHVFVTVELKKRQHGFIDVGVNGLDSYLLIWNHGKTPAVIKEIYGVFCLDECLDEVASNVETEKYKIMSGVILGTENDKLKRIPITKTISGNEASNISSEISCVYYCGRINYEDVFGTKQACGFCWELRKIEIEPGYEWVISDDRKELKLNYYT